MRRYYPNESSEIDESRPIDTQRSQEVREALKAAGLPFWGKPYPGSGEPQPPVHLTVQPSFNYYAMEIRVWADTETNLANRDEIHHQAVAALRTAGYLTHTGPCAPHFQPVTAIDLPRQTFLAYLPTWGGNAPRAALMTQEVATYLGVEPSTLRSYVSRGQAPAADAGEHQWHIDTIDQFVATRPGKAGRPPKGSV